MARIQPPHPRYFFKGDPALPCKRELRGVTSLPAMFDAVDACLERLSERAGIDGEISSFVAIEGAVTIGPGTKVDPFVSIEGPAYIGANCTIRQGALIRPGTILGDECVVGHAAEIKASLCMSGSKMQSSVFVGNSIVGMGARLGSGTILANRRFDQSPIRLGSGKVGLDTGLEFLGAVIGDYARLGASVVTAPGTLVGPYTWITSLVSVSGFVERAKLVVLKQELLTRDKDEVGLRSGRGEYERA